jgi:cold-inducible RNA-binding protein
MFFFRRAMSSKIFVGNLSWNTTNESLQSHFAQFGTVTDSIVIRDRETGNWIFDLNK